MQESKSHNKIILKIKNNEYEASLYLSTNDMISLIESDDVSMETVDNLIALILLRHIVNNDPEITVDDIISGKDEIFPLYIQSLVENESLLQQAYEKHSDELNLTVRLAKSAKESWKDVSKPILANLPKITTPLASIVDNKLALTNNISSMLSSFGVALSAFQTKVNYTSAIFNQVMEPINRISEMMRSITIDFTSQLSGLFEQIKIPNISEERKKELQVNFSTWGQMGWTLMPHAEFTVFKDAPNDIKDANQKIKSWCTKEDVDTLFDALHCVKGVNKKDLDIAIELYRTRQYKPCAMLLFSLLDAKIIRMQKKEDRNPKNNRRFSGTRAIQKIKERIESEKDINEMFFTLLSYSNLFACAEVFFKDADDFKKQPELINRNFLQHGMLTRKVKKYECIQLFLLYYNFLEFFDISTD